jgi:hypothetical protein
MAPASPPAINPSFPRLKQKRPTAFVWPPAREPITPNFKNSNETLIGDSTTKSPSHRRELSLYEILLTRA